MCTGITALVRGPTASSTASGSIVMRLVDVDDHRDRAGGEHRHGGRHVGVRRHQDLVARADAERDHRGRQRVGAAAGQRHVTGAEVFRVALLEAGAFGADPVAEQGAAADHLRDRVDLFLSDDVHEPTPLSVAPDR